MLYEQALQADLCVVGGGMAGISAAIAAAREGLKVVLLQERPVYGGMASSEMRMWICGVGEGRYRETGLLEEILLENFYRNPNKNWYLWSDVLFEKVRTEKNIIALLNCTCYDAVVFEGAIQEVKAYQMTTQTRYTIKATYFADCSGDSILGILAGAEYMEGRESASEYGETICPREKPDAGHMGSSLLLQIRKTDRPIKFIPPETARKISPQALKEKRFDIENEGENFWYIELGGMTDTVREAEITKDKLLDLLFGVWDCIKNSGEFDAETWDIEFIGFIPGKRESKRLKGAYVMTANDIVSGGHFRDVVAYGGWPLDNHDPLGFDSKGFEKNLWITLRQPYGIPLRCLYSVNINNLFFAGRNISLTHLALSSARVMATCTLLGEAVGLAAVVAVNKKIYPAELPGYIEEVQRLLLKYDCYLPYVARESGKVSACSELFGTKNVDILRNGKDRNLEVDEENRCMIPNRTPVTYEVGNKYVEYVKIVFDSDLLRSTFTCSGWEKSHNMRANIRGNEPMMYVPKTLAKVYQIEVEGMDGVEIFEEKINRKRNVLIDLHRKVTRVRLIIDENWGNTQFTPVFTFELF